MPMPYSHMAVAHSCLLHLPVDSPADYYAGAFMPDIRYFTKQPRETTHFSIEHLHGLAASTNTPAAFVLGYQVHLLLDELWAVQQKRGEYQAAFPVFLRKRMANIKMQEVALEIYTLQQSLPDVAIRFSENGLTKALGVSPDLAESVLSRLQEYVHARSLRFALDLAEASGVYSKDRLAEMRQAVEKMESNWVLRQAITWVVRRATQPIYDRLIRAIVAQVEQSPAAPAAANSGQQQAYDPSYP